MGSKAIGKIKPLLTFLVELQDLMSLEALLHFPLFNWKKEYRSQVFLQTYFIGIFKKIKNTTSSPNHEGDSDDE